MHTLKHRFLFVFLAGCLLCVGSRSAQTRRADQSSTSISGARTSAAAVTTVDQAIDRIVARERDEIATIWRFHPVEEVYIQDMKPGSDTGAVPAGDHYYLGSANLAKGVMEQRFLSSDKEHEGRLLGIGRSESRREDSFVKMVYADPADFDRQHYEFEFVRHEFLGDVRCVVFDVTPLPDTGEDRFLGRIWAEDQNFTIVRVNGVHRSRGGTKGREVHFDSWRLNLEGSSWLPAYIYAEQSSGKDRGLQFKAQTRFWGYGPKGTSRVEEDVQQASGSSERNGQDDAANRTISQLESMGLVAPRGELDHIMEIVVNNLEVTNNLDIQPEIRCRTVLTTSLESFSIGHTIVLSRGLLDALPDEASLAAMLAQEMATILVPAKSDQKTGDDTGLARLSESGHFRWNYSDNEVQAASQKALELMRNSPYKDKLDNPGLFLEQVSAEHKVLTALISPRVGNRAYLGGELAGASAGQRTGKSGQYVAVRMGTRVKLDPWSNEVALVKAKPAAPLTAGESDPFELFPFFPFLTRGQGEGSVAATHDGTGAGRNPATKPSGSKGSTPADTPPTPPQ
jgi:hypothetical protein